MRASQRVTRCVVTGAETLLVAGLVPAFVFAAHAAGVWLAGLTVWATAAMIGGLAG